MALQEIQLDRERFSCSICLDLLKEPVTIGCGHSYCMGCINTHFDHQSQTGNYRCPQCRQRFTQCPDLGKNTLLADLMEELKKTGPQTAPAGSYYAGPEDVACDVCTGSKRKALKSCLICMASYCEQHLWPHLQSPGFKRHRLMNPSKKLKGSICPQHGEELKMFCRNDRQCICYLCSVDEHKDHDIVSVETERFEVQRELRLRTEALDRRLQCRQEEVELLQQKEEALNRSADQAVADSEKTFTTLICLLEKRNSDVKQHIRSKQETEASHFKELQERLEQEIAELKRKDEELEQLTHTQDHIQFLHNCPSLTVSDSIYSSSIRMRPLKSYVDVTAAVAQVRIGLQNILPDSDPVSSE